VTTYRATFEPVGSKGHGIPELTFTCERFEQAREHMKAHMAPLLGLPYVVVRYDVRRSLEQGHPLGSIEHGPHYKAYAKFTLKEVTT
jgi:hypothetical protein